MPFWETLRLVLAQDITLLFRRYFINTLFDATFVVLGILASTAFVEGARVQTILGTIFAACLAIGISTGVSVYEAEHAEGAIRMRRLERAMLRPLDDTDVEARIRASRYAIALVNFTAPLLVFAVTSAPLALHLLGVVPDLAAAALAASAVGFVAIFLTGYYLGTLTGRPPWGRALRMSAVALLTFLALVALHRIL